MNSESLYSTFLFICVYSAGAFWGKKIEILVSSSATILVRSWAVQKQSHSHYSDIQTAQNEPLLKLGLIPPALFGTYEAPCESIFAKFMRNGISWKIWKKWDQPRPSTIKGLKVKILRKKTSKTKDAKLIFTLIFVEIMSLEFFLLLKIGNF
jgi:hypothetical protein